MKKYESICLQSLGESFGLDSILCSQSTDTLINFDWSLIYDELRVKSPIFIGVLIAATETRTPRSNRVAVICVCASILLKFRFKKMNLVQKLLAIILYASHCSTEVFQVFVTLV